MKRILFTTGSAMALLAAAPALAQNNMSDVTQQGTGAEATVNQTGANSDSDILQLSGGEVTVNQSGSTGSESDVTTEASPESTPPGLGGNTVEVTQTDDGTAATALGQANKSTVIQDNVNLGTTAVVEQTHNAAGAGQNESFLRQGRNASNGDVTVNQMGGDNFSTYTSTTSTDNDANIVQTGQNNRSDVQQDFQNGGALVTVNQNNAGGADNNVFIDQISAGFATDDPNTPQSEAQFALGADATALQDGSNLTSTISQTGYADMASEANTAKSDQQGEDHTSSITQSGVENFADVLQTGVNNDSIINQSGNNNDAMVQQSSNDNMSTVMQPGSGNSATVTQGGSAPNNT
jgi:trimeric autotransporter adhesin